ncbi:MAG: putative aspartate aminotransferase 2 [Methanomethylovorans sp. PtaU1.Bin093]|uniref:aminotransferase class I/II-fold pyridoxal phosphate-dependent enzyme n=1 Tax=Methanomethylovorans sp. PtaU1.Bin093 TaxID=1811679 RepID=UPI0009CB64C3|nr:aminotransferase class I/II-fold pyridoxal phosphate-dependent enzyme [Methanomethylovorans sp. PtaU1.Bin093]OPY20109.1 MAG: putative aspartate aminotransferase 2 [Methanomethylovorans sp. PtaU1.Bin093]
MNDRCDPERFVADVMTKVPPSGIRKYFDLASGIEGVISLGVGEPDFVTPWHIREACIHSLESGKTSYTSNFGLLELREEIAKLYSQEHCVHYDPASEILVMSGVSEALDVAIRAITNPGDEIIVPQPAYVAYVPSVMFAGGVPVPVITHLENNFKLTAEDLEKAITPRTKALIINYPNNPTGATMDRKDLEAIAKVASEHDIMVISDEVYECLTYNGKHTCFSSIEGMKDRTILLNGFSKAYAMTGFRLAYALAPSPIINAMMRIHQYCMLCAPITAQVGAIEALRNGNEEMQRMIRDYDRRRHLIISGLNRIGLECYEPKGAFYAFPSVKNTGLTSEEFAERLLHEQKVVTIPGDVFGPAGEGFLRCSYATSKEQIVEALDRMKRFVGTL